MDSLAEQVIIDIIRQFMDLGAQRAWVRSQNHRIPEDDGLFIIAGLTYAPRVMSSQSYLEQRIVPPVIDPPAPEIVQQWEISRVQMAENIQVDIFSRNNEALMRRWEIVAAMTSIYSEQQQEANVFRIFRQPATFLNTSDAEGGSNLNRFSITFPCFVWYKKERLLTASGGDYYDDFTTRVDDANTITEPEGLFSFRITPEGVNP